MIRYQCDKCEVSLRANDPNRYIVKVEVYAAASHIELSTDTLKDHSAELEKIVRELRTANADDVEDRTYRCLRFDLCDTCRRAFLARPLGGKNRRAET